ncbi:hypothetical protein G6O67_006368 [Ophiocordyceps sinensis]|uniref:Uncharacterized protein n=1 Tax=Ophiocordyceps sinensis TaxID=72228 RepID=A0A8H4LWQ5_9HYPO|nr:hypothetical protein G6O67_006368 [Ophiocordyceps sinensis]
MCDRLSAPSHSASGPLSQKRFLLRRERDRRQRLENQVARGRPDAAWRRCGVETCTWPGCRYEELAGTVRDKGSNHNGVPVKEIFQRFADEMVGCIWPEECLSGKRSSKHRTVESFATSPPTRLAFWRFQESCREQQLKPSENAMQKMVVSLLPELQQQMPVAESLVHQEAEPDCSKQRRLQDSAMGFVVDVEVWRRSQDGRFRDWTFGQRAERGEFLAALLLNLWLMDREDCFEAQRGIDRRRCDELWQEWLDEYPGGLKDEEEVTRWLP